MKWKKFGTGQLLENAEDTADRQVSAVQGWILVDQRLQSDAVRAAKIVASVARDNDVAETASGRWTVGWHADVLADLQEIAVDSLVERQELGERDSVEARQSGTGVARLDGVEE